MRQPEELAAMMAASAFSSAVQIRQTRYRAALADHWNVPQSGQLLEIGCGQGDMTAVLADRVGALGRVLAVDEALPTAGSPVTLGDSARHLSGGPLGERVQFRFGFDPLSHGFETDRFDAIVLAHCLWYFDSLDILRQTLRHIRPWASRLFLAEWDLEPVSYPQLGHFLAVLVQGQLGSYSLNRDANVRTPFSRQALGRLLEETGWSIESEASVDSSELDDGRWEIESCLAMADRIEGRSHMPDRLRDLVDSEIDLIRRFDAPTPLPSYSMVATRRAG